MEKHVKQLLEVLNDWGVQFQGSGRILASKYPDQGMAPDSESALAIKLEGALQISGFIRQGSPMTYWRPIIEDAIHTAKVSQLRDLFKKDLAFDGKMAEALPIADYAALLVEGGKPTEVEVAVLYHFIWQVKRKALGLPVSYHMMPVICGPTGSGKSEAIRRLLSPLGGYVLNGLSLDKIGDDRYYRQLDEHLVVFFDEMAKLEKASNESLKQVITANDLTGRRLYSNSYTSYKQRSTFIGASNASFSELIKDDTSMRRYFYYKSPAKMDWDKINAFDVVRLWKSVDETIDTPTWITGNSFDLQKAQEAVRHKTALECFIEEGYLTATPEGSTSLFESGNAYVAFREYCEASGHNYPISKQSFNKQLTERFNFVRVDLDKHNSSQLAATTARLSRIKLFPTFFGILRTTGPSIASINDAEQRTNKIKKAVEAQQEE